MARKGLEGPPCQVPQGPCPGQYKGWRVRKQHSLSSPESDLPAASSTDPFTAMKSLLLTLGLGLMAALRAQTLPVWDEETQDVRLRRAGCCRAGRAQRPVADPIPPLQETLI